MFSFFSQIFIDFLKFTLFSTSVELESDNFSIYVCPEPGDLKNFGALGQVLKKWRGTSEPNLRQFGQFGEKVRLEKKSQACPEVNICYLILNIPNFTIEPSNNLKKLMLIPVQCACSTMIKTAN